MIRQALIDLWQHWIFRVAIFATIFGAAPFYFLSLVLANLSAVLEDSSR